MANAIAFPGASLAESRATSDGLANARARVLDTLASVAAGASARIISIGHEDQLAAWLRAVGMREQACVTVLRRAPFGGPIHVRTSDGGEFAIHRDLARAILIVPSDEG